LRSQKVDLGVEPVLIEMPEKLINFGKTRKSLTLFVGALVQ
jgi:hypothetical protein